MTREDLFRRLEKLDAKDTHGFSELTAEADKAGILDADTAQIIANSVFDQDAYFDDLADEAKN